MSKIQKNSDTLQLGITEQFNCSYLPDRKEQLVFIQNNQSLGPELYEALMARGFRRSGNDAYQPHCPHCVACQSTRILTSEFTASRSQKRLRNKNKDLRLEVSQSIRDNYFELYSRYIHARHQDGGMFPPQQDQFDSFAQCQWLDCVYLELYLDDELISVSINDMTPHSLSAVYTFFDPTLDDRSLGIYNILTQIDYARDQGLPHVYLGYQIDECSNMRYKQNFHPQERFINGRWVRHV